VLFLTRFPLFITILILVVQPLDVLYVFVFDY